MAPISLFDLAERKAICGLVRPIPHLRRYRRCGADGAGSLAAVSLHSNRAIVDEMVYCPPRRREMSRGETGFITGSAFSGREAFMEEDDVSGCARFSPMLLFA